MEEVGNALDKCRYQGAKTASKIPCIGIVNWYATTGSVTSLLSLFYNLLPYIRSYTITTQPGSIKKYKYFSNFS